MAWDQHLIAEPEGPSSSLVQLRVAVWTGNARDTRPKSEVKHPIAVTYEAATLPSGRAKLLSSG